MANVLIYGVDPGSFAYDPANPTKFTEHCSHNIQKNLYNLQEEGLVFDDGQIKGNELDTLWSKQNSLIDCQSAYLGMVKQEFQRKKSELPLSATPQNLVAEWIDEKIDLVGAWVEDKVNSLDWILSQFAVSLQGHAVESLAYVYDEGGSYVQAMIDENTGLKSLTKSTTNYDRRRQTLVQHDNALQNLLLHLSSQERVIDGKIDENVESLSTDWKTWVESCFTVIDTLDEWFTSAEEAALTQADEDPENDLPIPAPPELPSLPPTTDIRLLVLYYLLKYGVKMAIEWIAKWIKRKMIGDGGGEVSEEKLDEIIQALKDLKYNDEELDFGAFKAYLRSKVIEY